VIRANMNETHKGPDGRPSIQALADWSLADEQAYGSDLVVRQSRMLVLDTIGCAIAGTRSDVAAAVLGLVLDSGGAPQCTIIGSQLQTSLPNAVLVNGVQVRSLDLNDVIFIQKDGKLSVGGHPSDNIPVALSTGEMAGSTLGQVLEAIVVNTPGAPPEAVTKLRIARFEHLEERKVMTADVDSLRKVPRAYSTRGALAAGRRPERGRPPASGLRRRRRR
jgi:hypothetical protein